MIKGSSKMKVVATIEDASILRKFTVLFVLMSIVPVAVLFYFYIQIKEYGNLFRKEV